jgi:hypothetical protein
MIMDLLVKQKSINFLGKNTRKKSEIIKLGKEFLDLTTKI